MSRIAVAGATGAVGRHVVEALHARGHEPVALSRASGVDLLRADGLAAALEGCTAVIDVASQQTLSPRRAVGFFTTVTEHLLAAETRAGVAHHVVLSIVGAAATDAGYYAGKAAQERLVMARPGGWSLLRATQFHEFAEQTARRVMLGLIPVPKMRCRPVAAAEVAAALADIAGGAPAGLVPDLGGPEIEQMADMVRRYVAATGRPGRALEIRLPGAFGRALSDGTLLPGPDARLGAERFDEWLARQPRAGR